MKESIIKRKVKKFCPNCEADERFGEFKSRNQIYSKKNGKIEVEECPTCGAFIMEGENVPRHTMSIREIMHYDNDLKTLMMECPDLNKLVRKSLEEEVVEFEENVF